MEQLQTRYKVFDWKYVKTDYDLLWASYIFWEI